MADTEHDHEHDPDDDFLDGCDVDMAEHALPEDHQDVYPLFAGVPADEVEAKAAEWHALAEAGALGEQS